MRGILAISLLLVLALPALAIGETQPGSEADKTVHCGPAGARLFAVPVLETGANAWFSVFDHSGKPLAGVSVKLGETYQDTDENGQVSFVVPVCDKFIVGLPEQKNTLGDAVTFVRTPSGFLISEAQAVDCVEKLEDLASKEQGPAITYAPSMLEAEQPFMILGRNFSGAPEQDRIVVDGFDSDVYAGSTVSLLATSSRHLSLGPLRDLYVSSENDSSNVVEVDVCKVDVSCYEADTKSGITPAKIGVVGTNFPAMVQLENTAPDAVQVTFNREELGVNNTFISPGGQNNYVNLEVRQAKQGALDSLDIHLVADAPWSQSDRSVFADEKLKSMVLQLDRAQILRLRRRLIGVEFRLDEEKRNHKQTGTLASLDEANARMRSLTLRQRRITEALTARRVLFEALGGTDEQYRAALAEAAGTSTFSLDNWVVATDASAFLIKQKPLPSELRVAKSIPSVSFARDEQTRQDMMSSMVAYTKFWKRFPAKRPVVSKLAAPPAPYMPDVNDLGPFSETYARYRKMTAPKPKTFAVKHVSRSHRHRGRHHH